MLNRFLFIICGLALLTGCQQQPAAVPLAYGPDVNTIFVTDPFISQAIAATGGYEAWLNTKSSRAYRLNLSTVSRIPIANSAQSSNRLLLQIGPRPSAFFV